MYILQKVKLSVIFNMCPIWNSKSIIIDFMVYSNSKHTAAYYLAYTNITTNYIISTMSCEEMRFGHWCTSGRKTSSYKATKKSKWMLESYHHKVPYFNHIESNNNNQKCDCFVLIDAIDYILVNLLATNLI